MEDILDTFLVRVEGPVPSDKKDGKLKRKLKKKMDSLFSLFSKAKARHDIAGAIEDIMKQLKEVDERRARYKLDDVVAKAAATSRIDPRLVAMNNEVNKLIGIDKSSGELSRMLSPVGNDSNGKIKIVSVVGVGGLGKTTLAQAVYDKLNPNFGCRAFVPVGRDRDVKTVLRDILIDLDNKYMDVKYNILDERQLIKQLKDFLRSNRYFIVIDDVWSTETWNIIRTAFVENDSGSRVIVTTRKREVASMAEEVYYLQPLSDDDSKMLLYTRLYGGEDKCPLNHPAEASEKILKKCGGVPLAVITMASGGVRKDGVIDSCRVHDMVLDLIRELVKKVNFVTISNDDGEGTLQRNKQVRSWFLHPSFKLLRVLALEECSRASAEGWQGLRHLGNLLHLSCVSNIDNLDDESKRQFMKDLGNLSQVRVLSIYGELRGGGMALQSELVQSLDNLHKLQHLRLVDYNFDGEDDTCKWVEWEDTVVLPRGLQVLDLHAVLFRRLPSCISPALISRTSTCCGCVWKLSTRQVCES
ncbi:hypothetical protein HU200_065176 [Digitaria exilis]|uniref:NB-ARC domain-containing protein n=1 Tax=Digitaria exilis TaxID=1010633 RepID=A0A835DXP8_9POAL|nr:hypothetical protein HU200_065176 [Digitaria exilis]